jgi:hypothetical protein
LVPSGLRRSIQSELTRIVSRFDRDEQRRLFQKIADRCAG